MDDCDHAGLWAVDLEVARLRIGMDISQSITYDGAVAAFGNHIQIVDKFNWFVVDFFLNQFSSPNQQRNKVYLNVIDRLMRLGVAPPEGPPGPTDGSIGIGLGIGIEKNIKESVKKPKPDPPPKVDPVLVYPFDNQVFIDKWKQWTDYRKAIKKPYKAAVSEQAALKKLGEFSEDVAITAIEDSIANGWQGLFPEKYNQQMTHGPVKNANTNHTSTLAADFARRRAQASGGS